RHVQRSHPDTGFVEGSGNRGRRVRAPRRGAVDQRDLRGRWRDDGDHHLLSPRGDREEVANSQLPTPNSKLQTPNFKRRTPNGQNPRPEMLGVWSWEFVVWSLKLFGLSLPGREVDQIMVPSPVEPDAQILVAAEHL